MESSLPIGVFDSGLGGLSILKELSQVLPSESFLYLGDVARLPYGTRSASVVTRYAHHCVNFLLRQNVKMIVVACNTATAMALSSLQEECAIEIHGVIEPGVRAGIEATRTGRVLVLGTEATVKAEAYRREFQRLGSVVMVEQLACPLLVPLAEEGWFDTPITVNVIETYLSRAVEKSYDAILLGCTHYPLLEASFRKAAGEAMSLVHGGPRLASGVKQKLGELGLLNPSPDRGTIRFFSTDHLPKSLPIIGALFGDPIPFELVDF